MENVLLIFYCALPDVERIAGALRIKTNQPIHVHDETVHGLDFSDANIVEQVTGVLQRSVISVLVKKPDTETLVAEVAAQQRGHPVRWVVVPVFSQGRLA